MIFIQLNYLFQKDGCDFTGAAEALPGINDAPAKAVPAIIDLIPFSTGLLV